MKRKAYGRDFGLSARMALTTFLLGLLYVVFFVVLIQVLNVGLVVVIVLMGGMLVLQLWFSDRLALTAAPARRSSSATRRRSCTTWSSGSARWPISRSLGSR